MDTEIVSCRESGDECPRYRNDGEWEWCHAGSVARNFRQASYTRKRNPNRARFRSRESYRQSRP